MLGPGIHRYGFTYRIICVAGAGRGGIVTRCISAMVRSGRKAHIYALEKNPNAYITSVDPAAFAICFYSLHFSLRLQERQHEEWGDHVSLVFGDMRMATLPEQVDILVSELLGSFGDNELSPECLDGAMRFLKRSPKIPPSVLVTSTLILAFLSSGWCFNTIFVHGTSCATFFI